MGHKPTPLRAAEARNLGLARKAAGICEDKRATDVVVLDMRAVCDFSDFFVIATATSGPQMKGILREVEKEMKVDKARLLNRNGIQEGHWALLDYGDVVIHVFDEETRDFYQLEHLWGDAKKVHG